MFSSLLTPMHSKEKQLVLRAIEHLGPSVTPDSISLETGIPVLAAVRQLNTVASETGAHLEVNANGGISYRFSPGFASAYTLNIGKQLFQTKGLFIVRAIKVIVRMIVNLIFATAKLAFGILWILIRISFAILLVASIILAICAMIAAIFGDSGGGGGDGIDLGGGGDLGGAFDFNFDLGHAFGDFVRCFDFTYWDWNCHGHYHYYDSGYGGSWSGVPHANTTLATSKSAGPSNTREAPKADFLNDVFSFLFGDGDPNDDLEQRQYRFIGSVIQRNNGAVVAEQLAPYTTGNTRNEDWMLPILVHFNGVPEVSESGTIVYLFPSFVNSQVGNLQIAEKNTERTEVGDQVRDLYRMHLNRQSGRTSQYSAKVPNYLQERPWMFSLANDGSIWCVFILALANLGGSWWLYNASMHTKLLLNLHGISVFMLGFAVFMLVMPALRWAVISMLNLQINGRNARRQVLASLIANADEDLNAKLAEARSMAHTLSNATTSEIIYTTERDALEQEFESIKPMENSNPGYNSSMRR